MRTLGGNTLKFWVSVGSHAKSENKLGFGSLKTSNFRVVLVTKSLAVIFSQQRLCQVPHQRLICRADPPRAEDWCCCNGP